MADQQSHTEAPATHAAPAPAAAAPLVQFSRDSVSLSAMTDSIAGGGASAGVALSKAGGGGSVADRAASGFSGAAQEVPHRKDMEKSFGGADFSGVKAYTDGPAKKANNDLGANAYAHGNAIAFKTANPSKALVAHELTHTIQQGGASAGPAASGAVAGNTGIDTSGEHEAEAVEAAVGAGKPATSALSGGTAAGIARKAKGVARESKFAMGLTFSPEGMEKSYEYKIWEQKKPFEVPIPAVPGLNFSVKPEVTAKAAAGVNWKEKALTASLGVEGAVEMGLSYGKAEIAEVYGVIVATADGGFEYKKSDKDWTLDGSIGLSANLAVGVSVGGGMLDNRFEFGKVEIGKLTGLSWKNGHFESGKVGWEWGEKPKEMFEMIKKTVDRAIQLAQMGAAAAKAAYQKGKQLGTAALNTVGSVVQWATGW